MRDDYVGHKARLPPASAPASEQPDLGTAVPPLATSLNAIHGRLTAAVKVRSPDGNINTAAKGA